MKKDNKKKDNIEKIEQENTVKDNEAGADAAKKSKKFKLTKNDIICLICAVAFCVIPFIPFINELEKEYHYHDGEYEIETFVSSVLYIQAGYLYIVLAVLTVATVFIKKNFMRIITMVCTLGLSGVWIAAGIRKVMKIFDNELYDPAVGYYVILVSSILLILALLSSMVKEMTKKLEEKTLELKREAGMVDSTKVETEEETMVEETKASNKKSKNSKSKNSKSKNSGFSLVELIIVIAIMVTLAGLMVPMFVHYVEKSREEMDINNMQVVYDVAYAMYASEETKEGVLYYYGREDLYETAPTKGYGKGGEANGGKTFPHPCCEEGEYDSSASYQGKYIKVTFPSPTSEDQTIHIHWVN